MNYQRHYDKLINRARSRLIEGYTETHHVIPKCLGGTDDADNLIDLTAEEHYVAHQLLVKIYPNHSGLTYAALRMSQDKYGHRNNNKLYGWLRENHAKAVSHALKGKPKSEEHKRKQSETMRGRKQNPLHSKKISMSMLGKPKSEEHKNNMRKPKSEEHKNNMRKPKRPHERKECPNCHGTYGIGIIKRYHLDKCKELVNK